MSDAAFPHPVNLNKASLEELVQLPGVGKTLARRIITARPFKTVRDLILIDGVSPKLYANLLPLIAVTDRPPRRPKSSAETTIITAQPIPPLHQDEGRGEGELEPIVSTIASQPAPAPVVEPQPAPEPLPTPIPVIAAQVSLPQGEGRGEGEISELAASTVEPQPVPQPPPPALIREASRITDRTPPPRPASSADTLITPRQRTGPQPSLAATQRAESAPLPRREHPPASRPARYVSSVKRIPPLTYLFYGGIVFGIAALFIVAAMIGLRTLRGATPVVSVSATATGSASSTGEPPTATSMSPTKTSAAIAVVTESATAIPSATSTPTLTNTSTATPAPTDTPAPTPPPGTGGLVFAETFDPPQFYWGVGNTSFSHSEMSNGQLTIRVNRLAISYVFSGVEDMQDFLYQAAVTAGPCGNGDHYGLQIRAKDDTTFYLFGITCEGRIRIQSVVNGAYTILVNDPPNPAVKIGEGAVNVVGVRMLGSEAQFYVNGELVKTVPNIAERTGHFGLYAKAVASGTLTVSFDDVSGWAVPLRP